MFSNLSRTEVVGLHFNDRIIFLMRLLDLMITCTVAMNIYSKLDGQKDIV
jgi:hypothetical protein